jgi:hypothetical protein
MFFVLKRGEKVEKHGVNIDDFFIGIDDHHRFVKLFYRCLPAQAMPFGLTVPFNIPVQSRYGYGSGDKK